ncbi:MAG: hypothetical protein QW117_01460 [Candidatus Pacearchaeota archaeon]
MEGFEGDEDWELKELPNINTLFKGWFKEGKGKLLEAGLWRRKLCNYFFKIWL